MTARVTGLVTPCIVRLPVTEYEVAVDLVKLLETKVITGYELRLLSPSRASIWVNAGVLSPQEIADLRASGAKLTNFAASIDASDPEAVACALATVREHHPGETICLEAGGLI